MGEAINLVNNYAGDTDTKEHADYTCNPITEANLITGVTFNYSDEIYQLSDKYIIIRINIDHENMTYAGAYNGVNEMFIFDIENDKEIDIETKLYKNTEIDIELINGSPFISVTIYPEGLIKSSGKSYNYTNNEHIKILENHTNIYLENLLKNYLYTTAKTYSCDIVGFGGKYATKLSTQEEFDNINWENIYKDSFFKVSVNTKINSSNLFNKQ